MTRRYRRQDPAKRFLAKVYVDARTGCWLWLAFIHKNGYGRFRLDGCDTGAHRAAYELFVGPIPDGLKVLHHCDVRPCVNPEHLFLGTQADNVRDMAAKSRSSRGTQRPLSKLLPEDVLVIRSMRGRLPQRVLAARFGVSQPVVCRVQRQEAWRHV